MHSFSSGPRWRQALPRGLSSAIVLVIAACGGGGGGGGGTSTSSLTDQWAGSLDGSQSGAGQVVVNFTESGSSLSGTWESKFADPSKNNSGTLSGTIDGNTVTLTLTPSDPNACGFTATGTRSGDNEITGSFQTESGYSVQETGTFDAIRRTPLTGTWSGTINDDVAGAGTVTVTFSQGSDGSLSGTFQSTFSNSSFNNQGSVSGEVSGDDVTVLLDSSDPSACDFNATGTRQGSNEITGNYQTTASCAQSSGGTFDITRQ